MIGLTEGRSVHYVNEAGAHLAAVIVLVYEAPRNTVNLFVYPRVAGESGHVVENVPFIKSTAEQRTSRPMSWHWCERVEA